MGPAPDTRAAAARVDGRTARAERTRRAIVDALLDLTAEGMYRPTAERIVERAGVSVRALWSNFKDLETLYAAAGERIVELQDAARTAISPTLPLPDRVWEFSRQRARLLEIVAPAARASALRLPFSAHVREYRAEQHARLTEEIVELFGAELGPAGTWGLRRDRLLRAILVSSSWPAWAVLRDELGLDVEAATAVLARTVMSLLIAALAGTIP